MGCQRSRYKLEDGPWICFSEGNDESGCLCTFPHNDVSGIRQSRLRSLALLGAAVHLAQNLEKESGWVYVHELPADIIASIDAAIYGDEDDE